jgi:hypothetical protein
MNTLEQMKAATELLESVGMVDTTSRGQRNHGTLEFTDPKDKPVKYTLHANGYYRKYIRSGFYSHLGNTECYQLNRTKRTKATWGYNIERILIPGEYLLMASRIVAIAKKSRKRNKK